jgi:hypothetical protein
MILHSAIISRLKGLITPEANDNVIQVPPLAVIPLPLRLPLQGLDTGPGSATEPVSYSFLSIGNQFNAASTAASNLNMGFLDVGLWELHGVAICVIDFLPGTSLWPDFGMAFIKSGSAVVGKWHIGNVVNCTTYHQTIPQHKQMTVQLDAITQVVTLIPATAAAQTLRVYSTLTAMRLH